MRPHRSRTSKDHAFLLDAFTQLDEVIQLRMTGTSNPQTEAAEQMIQRWLAVFAREHLGDICVKLIHAAELHAVAPTEVRLPHLKGEDTAAVVEEQPDGSTLYFLLETLRRVLCAAETSVRHVPEVVFPFCFARVGFAYSPACRRVAALCVGRLSQEQLGMAVDVSVGRLGTISSDREQREYVAYARAAAHLELSTKSAEQASATVRYLSAFASAMGGVTRGVLRFQICTSLKALLPRLMDASTACRRREWRDFCAGGSEDVLRWWAAYTCAHDAAFKWAKKASHAPFCYELLVLMLALAASADCAPGGAAFATAARRSKVLALIAAGVKREPLRGTCVGLAAVYVGALPPADVCAELVGSGSSGGSAASLRTLVGTLLPRRQSIGPSEAAPIEETLLALARSQPDAAFVLRLIADGLAPPPAPPVPPSHSALLCRVLAQLSEQRPHVVAPHVPSLCASLKLAFKLEAAHHDMVGVAADGSMAGSGSGGGGGDGERALLLPALLRALPRLWSTTACENEPNDLACIAALLCSDDVDTVASP